MRIFNVLIFVVLFSGCGGFDSEQCLKNVEEEFGKDYKVVTITDFRFFVESKSGEEAWYADTMNLGNCNLTRVKRLK